jgi:hypothetical protein
VIRSTDSVEDKKCRSVSGCHVVVKFSVFIRVVLIFRRTLEAMIEYRLSWISIVVDMDWK